MNREQVDQFRLWLRRGLVGPIIVALTLASALNGFLQGLRDPLHMAASALINLIIRKYHLEIFPVAVPELFRVGIFEYAVVVTAVFLLGIALAYWMYPETNLASREKYQQNTD